MPYPKLIPCNPDLSQFLGKVPLHVRVYLLLRFVRLEHGFIPLLPRNQQCVVKITQFVYFSRGNIGFILLTFRVPVKYFFNI